MNKLITITLFTIVSITWGITFIAMKVAIDTIPPFFATSMRFLLTSPLLIVISYFTNTPLLFPSGQKMFQLFICIFYFSIPFSLMLYGGKYVNSTVSSIIFSITPVVILLLTVIFFKKKIYLLQSIGFILTILILSMILYQEIKVGHSYSILGICILMFSMVSHSIIYLYATKNYKNISILTFNTLPSVFSGLLLLLISMLIEHPIIYNFSSNSICAIIFLSYVSGVFGILAYFYLQKRVSAVYASIVFFIFPLITLFLNYYVYGYNIQNFQFYYVIYLMFSILLTLIPIRYIKIKKIITSIYNKSYRS